MTPDRNAILRLLAAHKEELVRRFQVRDIALFGSAARDSAREGGDIDILVAFDGPATSARYFGLQFFLEDMGSGCEESARRGASLMKGGEAHKSDDDKSPER